jgi:hypothetical protein
MAERTLYSLSKEDLAKMSVGDLADLIEKVKREHPGAKFSGTAQVRRADGTVKYESPQS